MLPKIKIRITNEKGFTLIEVIVSLVLVGIMAAIAGMGLVKIAEGYVFAKQNAEATQKAQVAMARIVKELSSATMINSTTTAPSVNYTRATSSLVTTPVTNNITLSGSTVKVGPVGTETILIDSVSAFTMAYYDAAGTDLTATPAIPANIRRIDISLTVSGANGQALPAFTNTVYIQQFY